MKEGEESDGVTEIPEDGENPEEQEMENKGEEKKSADSDGLENPEKTEEVIETDKTDESEETEKTGENKEDEEDTYELITYADDDIASGVDGGITWRIDADGKMTVSGTGDITNKGSSWPWYMYREYIVSVEVNTTDMTYVGYMFEGCSSLSSLDLYSFDISNVTDMGLMFAGCSSLKSLNLSSFDTSNVVGMASMFAGCSSLNSLDLSSFDTSNVTIMSAMFEGCNSLDSLNLSNFETSNVKSMNSMFEGCNSLSSLDISSFDTSNVTNMNSMFVGCSSLSSLDLSSFDTSKVTDMRHMFSGCSSLTSLDLSSFDTSKVTDMRYMFSDMFSGYSSLTSLDLSSFDTSKVTDMRYMFSGCSSLTSLDLSSFDTSNITNMDFMFYGCNSLNSLDLSNFDTSKATDMGCMFWRCSSLESLDLSSFDTSNVTDMGQMFSECSSLSSLDLSSFDTSNVTDMRWMFDGCSSLSSLDLNSFDTSNVTYMRHMFSVCNSLESLDLNSFDTSNVEYMDFMFYGCSNLESLDLSSFDTSNVTYMYNMFDGCSSLNSLNLSSFDTSNITSMYNMFNECSSLSSLDLSSFDMSKVKGGYMFDGCDNLSIIYAPYNIKISVSLPSGSDIVWLLPDGTEITELPQNLDHSVMITRRRNPQIITTTSDLNMDDVVRVKYVPYSYTVETNNSEDDNKVTFSIEEGKLAEGLQLYPGTGEIYGVPLETGEFPITVKAEFSNPEYLPSYANLTLTVLDNTESNVFGASDSGYEVEQYIGTLTKADWNDYSIYAVTESADQLFISAGSYNEFVDFWLNGQKLVDGKDYTKESGSTRITIRKQTFEGKAKQDGINTIAAEFRVDGNRNNDLKRTAQNFCLDIQQREDNNSGSGSSGSSHRSSHSSGGQSESVVRYSATSVVRLADRLGNPLPDTILELHSTPQEARTDQNGIAVFSAVESGAHTLYAKAGDGNVIASRSFELLFGDTVRINGDQLIVKAGTAFTLNVRVNGNELEFLSLQDGNLYQVIASATGDESSPEVWFLLSMMSVSAILGGVLYGKRRRYTVQ